MCPWLRAQDSTYYRAKEWRDQIDEYYKEDLKKFPAKGSILFVGSSSFRMWHDVADYFPNHRVVNRGFGGARVSDILYHMQKLVIGYKPSQIIFYCGENDLANGYTPEEMLDDVKCFVRMVDIHLPGVPILIVSVKPSPYSARILEKQQKTNALLCDFCRTKKHLKYLDISGLMMTPQGDMRPELYLQDRLHMTKEAYKLWAAAIEPYLIQNKSNK